MEVKWSEEQSSSTGSNKLLPLKRVMHICLGHGGWWFPWTGGSSERTESGELSQVTSSVRLLRAMVIIWLDYLWHEECQTWFSKKPGVLAFSGRPWKPWCCCSSGFWLRDLMMIRNEAIMRNGLIAGCHSWREVSNQVLALLGFICDMAFFRFLLISPLEKVEAWLLHGSLRCQLGEPERPRLLGVLKWWLSWEQWTTSAILSSALWGFKEPWSNHLIPQEVVFLVEGE